MRRLVKFLHTLGAIGLAGGVVAYMILVGFGPDPTASTDYATLRSALATLSRWLILPSMVVVILSGILAVFSRPGFVDAPWVWLKALTGLALFQATLVTLDGPAQRAARASARAAAGEIDAAALRSAVHDPWLAWWVIVFIAAANVALAIWRPRLRSRSAEV